MKILVLGNGFDVDHGLPTSYREFLHFCLYITQDKGTRGANYEKLTTAQKQYVTLLDKNKKLKDRFLELLENNNLFWYFSIQLDRQGKNWIDLEREIKSIVHDLRAIEEEYDASNHFQYSAESEHKIHDLIEKLGIKNVDSGKIDEVSLDYIHETLCNSLNGFSKALELYIVNFINTTTIKGVSPDIVEFDATNIITFNYSNTYERVYSGAHWREEIEHIHGSAQDNNAEETNVILGITTPAEKQDKNRYVEFEKYFQRITKRTGSRYKEWLMSVPDGAKTIEIMFFGHSLDASDSDIINDLVSNPNTTITICYHSEKSQKDIVANLIEIIGKQKLIEYVSGRKPKISFIKQKKHQHHNTAGVEIERDVRKLYKLYLLRKRDISNLLDKIENRLQGKKLSYFYTQRKTIDLFDALEYVGWRKYRAEHFLEICQKLEFDTTAGGSLKLFRYEDWSGETPWGDTIDCCDETRNLVDLVNSSNKARFQEGKEKQPYAYMHKLTSMEEIKEALRCILGGESSEKYWNGLNNLMHAMVENVIFYDAVRELEIEEHPIHINAKVKHFAQAYFEVVYDYQLQKDWEEQQKRELEHAK